MAENRKISRIKIGDETFDLKDPNQTDIEFDGSYDASTNKAATVQTVTDKINELDGGTIGTPGTGKTVTALSQLNGNISATFGDISITKSQVSDFPTSMPASDVSDWAKAATKPTYTYSEVGAASSGHTHAISIADSTGTSSKTLALGGKYSLTAGGTSYIFTMPDKPTYTYSDVGAAASDHNHDGVYLKTAPVTSVNSKTGDVTLSASDIGLGNVGNFKAVSTVANQGLTSTEQSNARANIGAGTSSLTLGTTHTTAAYGDHNHSGTYLEEITSSDVTDALGYTPYDSTNPNGYTSNTGTITSIKTTAGTHTAINKTSGAVEFNVPTKTSHLTNDSGFITGYTETDPTVPSWAKASTKPTYTYSEVGAASSDHTHSLSMASSTGTSSLTLAANTKYQLTAGGSTYIFTTPPDTTYSSKSAASGGTDVSLVTTGEKYTWNNKSSLALGETSSTAYRGDRGKTAYDHSQSTHARTDATAVTSSTTNGNIKIDGTETTVYTHPGSGTNPHGTTASDVGLGNVGNFKAVSTVASQGLTSTEQSNARTNIGAGTSNLTIGTTATTAAAGNHTHSISLATSTGTNQLTMEPNTKYVLTAGGNSFVFTTPEGGGGSVPTTADSNTTGISIGDHSTGTVTGVQSTTTTASKMSGGNGTLPSLTVTSTSVVTSATVSGTTLTLGTGSIGSASGWSAGSLPTWSATDVTVPIKNTSASTFVTGTSHTITDNGHTHTLS